MKIGMALVLSGMLIMLFLLSACAKAQEPVEQTNNPSTVSPTPAPQPIFSWDPEFTPPQCRALGNAPLLDQALANIDLNRNTFGFGYADWFQEATRVYGYLDDEFVLPWLTDVRARPALLGCLEGKIAGALDYSLEQPHPVAGMIRHATELLGLPLDNKGPVDEQLLPKNFEEAIKGLCSSLGEKCGEAAGNLPADLAQSLTPLIAAIQTGIDARNEMEGDGDFSHSADWWQKYGGDLVLLNTSLQSPDLSNNSDRNYLVGGAGRLHLYHAAAKIAFAIEEIRWEKFTGRVGVNYSLETNAGWIIIRGASDDTYANDGKNILLLIDLGGNDTYLNGAGSNQSGANSVSIAIDLVGKDTYTYETYKTPYDDKRLLPVDEGGRYQGDGKYGHFTLSNRSRQGAARNGIAMLFDLGGQDDHYQSLRASQGYAHLGVGVLFDDGGNDTYLAEADSQGAAQFGIALLLDAGNGNDLYSSFTESQGFGYSGGVGIILDEGGDDKYLCESGDSKKGSIHLYYSPQLTGKGNSSFCQGTGMGRRGNDQSPYTFLSGGVGILRDIKGDDRYDAAVFAQGAAFWQAVGILSDGEGNDIYNGYWYIQGAVAHFAVGILADAGSGDDIFNKDGGPYYVKLGAGHDFGVGFFVNEQGNDQYYIDGSVIAGASNCNGIGLFVDNQGDDRYISSSDYGSGMGNVSQECIKTSPDAVSIGIMIDGGGKDIYEYPNSEFPLPGDGKTWGHARNGLPSERGAGLDAEGETGVHAESSNIKIKK